MQLDGRMGLFYVLSYSCFRAIVDLDRHSLLHQPSLLWA